ncbi:MAG: hypothetical protein WD757_01505 [Actinomycetota bacterium]
MEFRVELLGGLRVIVGDRAIEPSVWTRKHPRALLALLALTAGHRLHREQLADALWPDLDPDSAAANLRKALHHAENPRHFVSFAEWKDEGSRKGWQSHEEFPAKLSRCRELCDEFVGGSYDLAARVS